MDSTSILDNKTISSIEHFIGMAIKNEMSWHILTSMLKDMMTTIEKSHQVIEVMVESLQSMSKKQSHDFENEEGEMKPNGSLTEPMIEIKQDSPYESNPKKIRNVITKDSKATSCQECGEMFSNDIAFRDHTKTHYDCGETIRKLIENGEKLYTFIGSSDKERLSSKENLDHDTNTQKSVSEKDQKTKHTCEICKKSFSQKCNLSAHKVIHTGEIPFECKTCKKRFTHRSNLIAHEKIHSNGKPFQCSSCKYESCTKNNLRRHEIIHTDKRSFKCNTCLKSFTQSHVLKTHIRIHTGERPYKCVSCDKGFISNSKLRRHESNTHKNILNHDN